MNDPTQAHDGGGATPRPEGEPESAPIGAGTRPAHENEGAAPVADAACPATDDAIGSGEPGADETWSARRIQRGLLTWLAIIAGGGVLAILLGHVEGAILFAAAGAFVLAQASDAASTLAHYRAFVEHELPPGSLHGALARGTAAALVPLAGTLFYVLFGAYAWKGAADTPLRFTTAWCFVAAGVCVLLAFRPVADEVTRTLFGGEHGRTRRLSARLIVMALLMPVPASALMPSLLANLADSGQQLASASGLTAQLAGEIAIALAGVGLFVRRDWRAARERLGLGALAPGHFAVIVAGVLGAIVMNGGLEWIERHVFPALWQQDSDATKLIVGNLSLATSLLLGVSAGVGEEVMVRGALQPRLGVLLSSLVFASGHVQYSWFGIATVGLLGVVLGVIRNRTNTTTAIVVHALYDIYAVVSSGG